MKFFQSREWAAKSERPVDHCQFFDIVSRKKWIRTELWICICKHLTMKEVMGRRMIKATMGGGDDGSAE